MAKRRKSGAPDFGAPLTEAERRAFEREHAKWRRALDLLAHAAAKLEEHRRTASHHERRAESADIHPDARDGERDLAVMARTRAEGVWREWNELARAVAAGAPGDVVANMDRRYDDTLRASLADTYAVALEEALANPAPRFAELDPSLRWLPIRIVSRAVYRIDPFAHPPAPEMADAKRGAAETYDWACSRAADDRQASIETGSGPVAAGVACAARLCGVSVRTIWNAIDRNNAHRGTGTDRHAIRESVRRTLANERQGREELAEVNGREIELLKLADDLETHGLRTSDAAMGGRMFVRAQELRERVDASMRARVAGAKNTA